jgi:hypothetical protein
MPGMAYPATVLTLATATSYPPPPNLFGKHSPRALGVAGYRGGSTLSRSSGSATLGGGRLPLPDVP